MEHLNPLEIIEGIAIARGMYVSAVHARLAEWFAVQNTAVQALVLRQVDVKAIKPEALKVVYLGFKSNKAQ